MGAGRGRRLVKDPITSHGAHLPEEVSLARYQATRERLSRGLFEATEAVAAYDWDADGIRTLLRRFSSAMGDEVEHLDALTLASLTT